MKIKDSVPISAQSYVEIVTDKCCIINDMKDVSNAIRHNGYEFVCLDNEVYPLSYDNKPIYYVSLSNIWKLFDCDFCKDREFVMVETAKDSDVSCLQKIFLCEIPTQKTFTVTIEETISEDFIVYANSSDEAKLKAIDLYNDGVFVVSQPCLLGKKIQVTDKELDTSSEWEEF